MKPKVRLGVIGAGMAGTVLHLPMLLKNPRVEIVWLADVSNEKLSEFDRLTPNSGIKTTTDAQDIIADSSIDAVLIASPTDTHVDLTIAALQKGKHVFCEKPISNNLSTAHALVKAAQEHSPSQIVMIGQVLRFWPDYVEIKRMIDYGQIGEPVIARAYRANPMPKSDFYAQEELSGGVIIDLGLHDIDFLAWALGPVKSVFAQGGNFSGRGGDTLIDYAQIHFNFESGAIAHLEVNWALPATYPFTTSFEIVGTAGMIAVDNSQARTSLEVTVAAQSPSYSSCSEFNGYYHEQEAFLKAVQNGAPSPVPPSDAMYAMILATAAKESIKRRKAVTPEEVEALSLSSPGRGALT